MHMKVGSRTVDLSRRIEFTVFSTHLTTVKHLWNTDPSQKWTRLFLLLKHHFFNIQRLYLQNNPLISMFLIWQCYLRSTAGSTITVVGVSGVVVGVMMGVVVGVGTIGVGVTIMVGGIGVGVGVADGNKLKLGHLTHWGWHQIDAISQTTLSNAFPRMKMNEFRLGFHWSLFLKFELTIFQHWFR